MAAWGRKKSAQDKSEFFRQHIIVEGVSRKNHGMPGGRRDVNLDPAGLDGFCNIIRRLQPQGMTLFWDRMTTLFAELV